MSEPVPILNGNMISLLEITRLTSRRRKHPIDIEVSIEPYMNAECWWTIYRVAVEFDGQLGPANIPPKYGDMRRFLFLRFPTEEMAEMAEAAIRSLLQGT